MKYSILLMPFFLSTCVNTPNITLAQNKIDSLKKYSYLISIYKDTQLIGEPPNTWHLLGIGSAFFIRRTDGLYLISAYHIFTQTKVIPGSKDEMMADIMRLRIVDSKNGIGFFPIDLRTIKERGKKISLYNQPDVYAYKITDTNFLKIHINTVNDILKENRDKIGCNEKVIGFGYPSPDLTKNVDMDGYKDSMYVGYVANKSTYILNPEFENIDSLNTILTPASFNGASGSPIFYVYSKTENNNTIEWVEFAGLMAASNPTYNFAAIVKKEFVVKQIEKQLKVMPH